MSGTTIAQAIPIIISPVLSRIYTPQDFGVYALYTALVTIFVVVATGQYHLAIMLPKKQEEAFNLLSLSLLIALFCFVLFSAVAIYFNENIADLLNEPLFAGWVIFFPIGMLFMAAFRNFTYWFSRKKKFKYIATATVGMAVGTASFQLLLGYFDFGPGGLVFGNITGLITATLIFVYLVLKFDRELFPKISSSIQKEMAVKHREFPQFATWATLLNSLSTQVPVFLLSYFFDNTIVGFFAFGLRLLNKPINLLGASMAQVFYQRASRAREKSKDEMTRLVWKLFSRSGLVGFLPTVILVVYAPILFETIFGPEWETAGVFVRWLAPWYYMVFLTKPIMNVINIEKKLKANLVFNILFITTRVVALVIGGYLQDPHLTIILYGMVSLTVKSIHLIWILHISGIKLKL